MAGSYFSAAVLRHQSESTMISKTWYIVDDQVFDVYSEVLLAGEVYQLKLWSSI